MQGRADNVTVVTYSIKFYYTPEFAAATPDIEGSLDQVMAETNQGYKNSWFQLKVVKHCSEKATINDNQDGSITLNNYLNMKGTANELRGSSDAAALLVNNFGNLCGIGYFNSIGSGNTVTVTMKSCAVGYYSFDYEVGHNIGPKHNPASSTNEVYPYGHGT